VLQQGRQRYSDKQARLWRLLVCAWLSAFRGSMKKLFYFRRHDQVEKGAQGHAVGLLASKAWRRRSMRCGDVQVNPGGVAGKF